MHVQSKSLFSYHNFVLAVSGAVGSVVGMITFYPLDTVRSRLQLEDDRQAKNTFQVIRDLVTEEGFSTLYRGIVPVLESICISNFIYFYTFHGLRNLTKVETGGRDLLLASVAGAINVLITSPLWLVNTKMKMSGVKQYHERYDGLIDGLLKICQREGVWSLWRGTIPSLILVSNPAIHMSVYESIKRYTDKSELSALQYFVISALAKATATMATYPLQLAQTKLRHGNPIPGLSDKVGTLQLLLFIMKKQGIQGLYKGMEAKLLQTILTAALMFMLYEKIAAFVFKLLR